MGKASRWLKGLFGMKKGKEHSNKSGPLVLEKKEKKRSGKDDNHIDHQTIAPAFDDVWYKSYVAEKQKENEHNKNAIFVRSLSHGSGRKSLLYGSKEMLAAVKIQTIFRGYLVCECDQLLYFRKVHVKLVLGMFLFAPMLCFFSVSTN